MAKSARSLFLLSNDISEVLRSERKAGEAMKVTRARSLLTIGGTLYAATLAWGQAVPSQIANIQAGGKSGPSGGNDIHLQYNLNNQGINQSREAYIQFSLAGFPSLTQSQIQKATLVLWIENGGTGGSVSICQVAQPWSTATITGMNAPSCTNTQIYTFSASASQLQQGSFVTVDITPMVQSWYNGTPNYGILLQPLAPAAGADATPVNIQIEALQNNVGYPPVMNLVLQSQGPQGVQGSVGATGPQGIVGAIGPQGLVGATGLQGVVGTIGPRGTPGLNGLTGTNGINGTDGRGFTFRGAFDASTNYSPYDVVTYNGSSYDARAIIAPSTSTPDLNAQWQLMASAGVAGANGAIGPQGLFGATGPQGTIGATGPQGATGLQGVIGTSGPQGLVGANGLQGVVGASGPQGTPGLNGLPGTNGTNGTDGQGFNFRGAFNASTNYSPYDVVTYNGSTYDAKAIIAPGTSTPDSNTQWQLMANAGVAGAVGATGSQGVVGVIGPQGVVGATGPQGVVGAIGPQGTTGTAGPQGLTGLVGAIGPVGQTGATGPAGATGATCQSALCVEYVHIDGNSVSIPSTNVFTAIATLVIPATVYNYSIQGTTNVHTITAGSIVTCSILSPVVAPNATVIQSGSAAGQGEQPILIQGYLKTPATTSTITFGCQTTIAGVTTTGVSLSGILVDTLIIQ